MKNAICGRVNHFFSSASDVKNNLSMQVLINFTQTRLRTCPSTIHLEMTVLPSLPGWNFMVAERGLMLEMTRLEGAPGSSVQQHNNNNKKHIYVTHKLLTLKHFLHFVFCSLSVFSILCLHYPSKKTPVNGPITHFRVN